MVFTTQKQDSNIQEGKNMSPRTIKITGQTLASIAAILAGGAAIIAQMCTWLPDEEKTLALATAAFLTAVSAYLAHKKGEVV